MAARGHRPGSVRSQSGIVVRWACPGDNAGLLFPDLPVDPNVAPTVDPIASEDDLRWMRHALALATRAEHEFDEIPVGAVLVDAEGRMIGEGWNRNISDHDPSAHAEIVAMREGGRALGNHRLVGCTLYITLEPCAMCAMAVVHARLARVVFAATDPKTGAAGSVFDLIADPRHNHRVEVAGGVLAEEASVMLTNYFRRKRGKPLL
jgi:tRNA(adenine34) deaminase